jgi:hypothetical protein
MDEQVRNKKARYVFQVIREDVVRTEIIKAGSQGEAEKVLKESDPKCTFKFLWIQNRSARETEPKNTWLRTLLIFAAIFAATAVLLLLLHKPNFLYLFFASFFSLFLAAIYEWWRSVKE